MARAKNDLVAGDFGTYAFPAPSYAARLRLYTLGRCRALLAPRDRYEILAEGGGGGLSLPTPNNFLAYSVAIV